MKVIRLLISKKFMGMIGCLVFFTVCIMAMVIPVEVAILNAVLAPLGLLIFALYGIKAISGNVSKRTDMLKEK